MKTIDWNRDWTFWREGEAERTAVTLPHDAMQEEPRRQENPSGSAGAYFAGGVYEYRKVFQAPAEWAAGRVLLRFEGVYRNARICLNQKPIGTIVNGYTERTFVLTPHLRFGEENEITVTVDNSEMPNSRWYSGSGIYRPVTLLVQPACHIEADGIQVRTLSIDPAMIEVSLQRSGGAAAVEIVYGETTVAKAELSEKAEGRVRLEIPDAHLWSDETPDLYTCRVTLYENGNRVDEQSTAFGIRRISWGPKGLFVNGKETLLRGGCVHHDNGVLGACAPAEAEARKVRIMKEAGFNAIRSSHNPCSRAMLDACDRYGVYMMDETWDMWYQCKTKYDYSRSIRECWKDDVEAMVKKDRNHPCVILYSIGNEISEPAKPEGMAFARELIDRFHMLDGDRAVTAGLNLMIVANAAEGREMYCADGGINADAASDIAEGGKMPGPGRMNSTVFNQIAQKIGSGMNHSADGDDADRVTSPILDALDIAGYNYASGRYPLDGQKHPDRVILGSETLPPDLPDNWEMVKKYPYLIGDFVWTAFDYLGEAGIGAWSYSPDAMAFDKPYPWLLSGAGMIDILGNPDAEAVYAGMVWGTDHGVRIAVSPANHPGEEPYHSAWRGTNSVLSWAWCGCGGNPVRVEVYTDAAEVELLVNGRSLGRKAAERHRAEFVTAYEPGTVTAVGYDAGGKVCGRDSLRSADQALRLCLLPEKAEAAPGEVIYIPVAVADARGTVESNADALLHASVEGGVLLGFGSANPRTAESFRSGTYTTFYGRALAVVRAGAAGDTVRLSVQGGGFAQQTVEIQVR